MEHFKHPKHPLIRRDNELDGVGQRQCHLCFSLISNHSSLYGCLERCDFYLHKHCAGIAPVIHDPLHKHPLSIGLSKEFQFCKRCNVIAFRPRQEKGKSTFRPFLCYGCDDESCDYVLDMDCALSNPKLCNFKFDKHRLFLSYHPMSDDRSHCRVCNDILYMPVFKCVETDCRYVIHLHCAPLKFPEKVQHRFYGWHNLVLQDRFVEDDTGEYYCDICEDRRHPDHPVYVCEECPLLLIAHLGCALSVEILQKLTKDHDGSMKTNANIYTVRDRYHMSYIFGPVHGKDCTICRRPFRENEVVHEWHPPSMSHEDYFHDACRKLALEIKEYPMHPQHSLTLLGDRSSEEPSYQCIGCHQYYFRFMYECRSCHFNLCIACFMGSNATMNMNYKDDAMHQLFLFDSIPFGGRCHHCDSVSSGPIFKCIEQGCTYNVHFHCAPFSLPQTVTNENCKEHGDLKFAKYSSSDTKCKICKDTLNGDPLYNCGACEYTAHVFCVLSESQIIPRIIADYHSSVLKKERITTMNNEIERLETKGDELTKKRMAVFKRMEDLKVKYGAELKETTVLKWKNLIKQWIFYDFLKT